MKNKLTLLGITLGLTLNFAAWADNTDATATPATPTQAAAAPASAPTMVAATDQTTVNSSTSNSSVNGSANSFTPSQTSAIQQIVHDYLVKNPDVLVEASQALQEREMAKAQQSALSSITQNKDKLFNDPNSPVMGNAKGNVTIVEFLDYQCGHCKNMSTVIAKAIKQNSNLRVVIKELPIFGAVSEFAAKAALASVKQGKFDAFHAALLSQTSPLSKQTVLNLAKSLGIDINKLQKDINNPEIAQQIKGNFQLAQNIRLMGTPAFVLGNSDLSQFKYIPGATSQDSLQQQINSLGNGSQPTSQQNAQTQTAMAPQTAQPSDQN